MARNRITQRNLANSPRNKFVRQHELLTNNNMELPS